MKKESSSISEYMKIRRHVITMIYRNEGKSVQIPTLVELSKQFNVSAPTVSKAMKALTEEGYIIGRRGIGSFTNPSIKDKLSCPLIKHLPIIGILFGDGMPVHFTVYFARILSQLLEEVTMIPAIIHQISLSSGKPETIYKEIRNEQLDGLIWYAPQAEAAEAAAKLAAEGFPLVTADAEIDGISAVSFDNEDAAYRCGKLLIADGRKNIVFFPDTPPWTSQANGLRRAYHEAGISLNDKFFLKDTYTLPEKLKEILSYGIPIDTVYGQMMFQNEIEDFLLEVDPKIYQRCCLVNAGISLPSKNPFQRFSYEYPFQKYAHELASTLSRKLNSDKTVEHKKIQLKIKTE